MSELDLEAAFTPHPGSARDAVQKAAAEAQPKQSATTVAPRSPNPVRVALSAAPDGIWRTMVVQPGQTRQLMPQDPARVRAVIVASTGPASKTYAGSSQNYHAVTSPAAGAQVVLVSSIPAGTYTIAWTTELEGTVSSSDIDNFELYNSTLSSVILNGLNAGAVGLYPQNQVTVTFTATTGIQVKAVAAGTTDAIYSAQVVVTPVYATNTGITQASPAALEANFVILCETQSLAQSVNNQTSGIPFPDGFLLPGNVAVETRNKGLVWVVNPNATSVQISVLTERNET
jgi:hypothetical protein